MPEKPTVAVVILNWNGKVLLKQFLPSVVKFSPEAVIYVADNASTDDSVSYLQSFFPSVKIIENRGNFGYANGYNEALKSVEEDIYGLVNSDIEVTENWLLPLLSMFENEPQTAIIQPKILDYKDKSSFEYAGAAGGFIDKYGFPFCRGRIFDTLENDRGQFNDSIDIFWASGACFFIRKKVFRELGGFDRDFFAHQEEIDLCWRAFNKNHTVRYCGHSTVYHVGGATLKTESPKKTHLNFRNSLAMLVKNVPKGQLLQTLFVRMILDTVAGLRFLLQGRFGHVFAILRAHLLLYARFYSNYRKRDGLQNKKYFIVKSIVYQYFIGKKHTFKELF